MAFKQLVKSFVRPSLNMSREDAMKVFKRDHFKCYYCGLDGLRRFENWLVLTVDHIHPNAKGGPRTMDNLVTACQPCNLMKGKRIYKSRQEAKAYVLARRAEWRKVFEEQVKAA
jgi:5-methylcytosine-specific restriction endonuclease McrA